MSSALVALLIQFRLSLAGSPRHDFRGHRHVPYLDASIELAQVRSVPSEILRHGTSKLTLARYSGSSSVPCVISLSTPKAMAVGTCVGAKKGILVAGGGTHALASLEGEDHVSFVFFRDRSENPALTRIVDDERKGGRVGRHGFYGGAVGADERSDSVGGWGAKDQSSRYRGQAYYPIGGCQLRDAE